YDTDVEYLGNVSDKFYFTTNIDAPNKRVLAVDRKDPGKAHWKEIIPDSKHVLTAAAGGGQIFAAYLADAQAMVKHSDLNGKHEWDIELPGIGTAGGFGAKFDDKDLYYSFTSFTTPTVIYRYLISTGESILYRAAEVDFNPDEYETKQVFYQSKD